MAKRFYTLENGTVKFRIADDATFACLETPWGSWECDDLVMMIYGGDITLNIVRFDCLGGIRLQY